MRFPNFDSEFEAGPAFEAGSDEFESSPLAGESDAEQMQLAAELLGVSSEEELEQFLGGLIGKAVGLGSSFLKSSAGQQLGGLLKSAAKKALPQVGQAIGGHFGGATGARIGGQLASSAGRLLGLELEGLSNEDSEFEMARQFVRFAQGAAQRLPGRGSSAADARSAYIESARENAPGLLPGTRIGSPLAGIPSAGRWVRRGRTITLM